jgi:hypothetical protein
MTAIRYVLCCVACLCFATVYAQDKVSFERLDSLSAEINRLEKVVQGRKYISSDSNLFELGFPEESFKVWSYNRMATRAIWIKDSKEDVLELAEHVDMSTAKGIWIDEVHEGVVCVVVQFPRGSIKKQVIGGDNPRVVREDYLLFFTQYGKLDVDKNLMFDNLFSNLCYVVNELKIEKGLLTKKQAEEEANDWVQLSNEDFVAKHPGSILAMQAMANMQERKRRK